MPAKSSTPIIFLHPRKQPWEVGIPFTLIARMRKHRLKGFRYSDEVSSC